MSDRIAVPAGLGPSGRALWRRVEGDLEQGLVFDAGEREVLRQACHASDRLAEVRRDIRERGLWVDSPKGEIPNPLLLREESLEKTVAALVGRLQRLRTAPRRARP